MAREIKKKVVSACPVCSGELVIGRLACAACKTAIETTLPIPPFFRLPEDLQEFVMVFLRCRGNIRDVEKVLGISYPTVCKRLDLVNALLGNTRPEVVAGREAGGGAGAVGARGDLGEGSGSVAQRKDVTHVLA